MENQELTEFGSDSSDWNILSYFVIDLKILTKLNLQYCQIID